MTSSKAALAATVSLVLLMGCKSKRAGQEVEETQPWVFPGEEVDLEDIPEGVVVEMSQPSIEGPHTDDDARGALRPQVEDLEKCYSVRLARHCKLKGQLRILLDVSQKGAIDGLQVLSDTTRDTRLGDCITKVIGKADFGQSEAVSKVTVTYTFVPPANIRCK